MENIILYKRKTNTLKVLLLTLSIIILEGCNKFLDVVPDDVSTLDHAFSNRLEAEKYLHTCYSYPFTRGGGAAVSNIMFFGSDEMWTYNGTNYRYESPWKIALGEQNIVSPLVNAWDGENHSLSMFKAIRDCNIFLENVSDREKVLDLDPAMRQRWLAEVTFLKAYYHFILLRMYGPIPIVDVNLPISASPDEVKVKRQPFDEVVDYIGELLDEAALSLPFYIENQATEAGRATKTAALMLKARLLAMAASPLFNGNLDYENFKDKDGLQLISPVFDENKWVRAREAAREALNAADEGGYSLYEFSGNLGRISDTTRYQMNIRGAVTEKWNNEFIWGFTNHEETEAAGIQNSSMAGRIDYRLQMITAPWTSYLSVTMNMAEEFYSDNGVPIDEDKNWDYAKRYELETATSKERFNIIEGFSTAKLNFNRENRFYGSVAFDGAKWFMQNSPNGSDENTFYVRGKFGEMSGKARDEYYNVTGYWPKKLVNWKYVQNVSGNYTTEKYPRPEMRLADLYLLYAEILNETGDGDEAIVWLNKVRYRAGLKGVKESWAAHAKNPNKPLSKDGLREIVHQERMIELAFEGTRTWDLRRWKKAEVLQNRPIKGWDINGGSTVDYYRVKTLHNMEFVSPRDYLWPIKEYNITVNPNLVQNPGW